MTAPELFALFLAGRSLPRLTSQNVRSLLDLARDKILSLGRKPRFHAGPGTSHEEKSRLLEAHRQLQEVGVADGTGQVYAQAGPQETHTVAEAERCLAMLKAINATPRKSSNRITATATRPPVKATATKPMTATKTKATARVPQPPPAKESNDAYLARRVAEQQSAARAVAAAAPKLEPRPLAEVETGELVQLARHEFARPAEKAAAAAELDRRPEVTVFARGSYSVSTRRQPKK
jgi:hypothetical protein